MTAWNICYFLHSKIKKTSHYLLLGFLVSSLLVLLFESHPSISLIKNEIINGNNFNFEPVSLGDIKLEIGLLNPKEATTPNVSHKNTEIKFWGCSSVLYRLFKETITKYVFLGDLKLAGVTSVFKKDDCFDKKKLQTCRRFTDYI